VVEQFKRSVEDRSAGVEELFGLVEFVLDLFVFFTDGLDFLRSLSFGQPFSDAN
jgi:hypothetical protein